MRILTRIKSAQPDSVKEAYMEHVEEFEKPEEIMRNRLILRRYLKELMVNQKRIHMVIRPEFNTELQRLQNLKSVEPQVLVYLKALDQKLGDQQYFGGDEPNHTDSQIYDEITQRGIGDELPEEDLPNLKKWYQRMK